MSKEKTPDQRVKMDYTLEEIKRIPSSIHRLVQKFREKTATALDCATIAVYVAKRKEEGISSKKSLDILEINNQQFTEIRDIGGELIPKKDDALLSKNGRGDNGPASIQDALKKLDEKPEEPPSSMDPTRYPPGSKEKLDVLRQRLEEEGEVPLCHPKDGEENCDLS